MHGPLTLGLAMAALAASAAGVWLSIRLAGRMGVMDIPNERSSHAVPTPRMGGVPMVVSAVLSFSCWSLLAHGGIPGFEGPSFPVLFAVAMGVLGFWDDMSSLSPAFRFLVQFAGALLVLQAGVDPDRAASIGGWTVPRGLWILAGAFGIVWMMNLYNFMDGIDGLAGGEAAAAASFFFLVFAWHGEPGWAAANLFVAASAMGFLVHNWPPARVFMGDAGSTFLGAFFGVQSVAAPLTTAVPLPVLVLPFANFILDATVTLLRRMWRREKWYLPHRSHFYQRMTDLGMSHGKVTTIELATVVLSCTAATWYLRSGLPGRAASLLAVLLVLLAGGFAISAKERVPRTGAPDGRR